MSNDENPHATETLTPDDLIERSQWDFFWVPDDVAIVEGAEMLYVKCARDVPMLNTVTRTRAEPNRFPALIAEVCAAHASVRSRWLVRQRPTSDELRCALDAAGYAPSFRADARAASVTAYDRAGPVGLDVRPVATMQGLIDCIAVQEEAFEERSPGTDEQLRGFLDDCTRPGARVHRFVAYDRDDRPVSAGGMTSFPDLAFGYLWGGGTVPDARGAGAYTAVVAARVQRAKEIGLTHLGVYANVKTSSPIVARQGFEKVGTMTYWDHTPDIGAPTESQREI